MLACESKLASRSSTKATVAKTVFFFSGFSVGFCINEEEGYLLPTIARKITCRRFD